MQIAKCDLGVLCKTARDPVTKKEITEEEKCQIRRRDLKTIEKYICIQKMDERAFDRTIEEIKHRYYEVARALLKHRGESSHRYLKAAAYDIEQEASRKYNYELVMSRGKESFEKEYANL